MTRLLTYIARETGFKSVHAFVRSKFILPPQQSHIPCYDREDIYVVGWNDDNYPKAGLILEQEINVDSFREDDVVSISCLAAFCNRGSMLQAPSLANEKKGPDLYKRTVISTNKQAIGKFCGLAGLRSPDVMFEAHLIQPKAEIHTSYRKLVRCKGNHRSNIENVYEISGQFLISDAEKFKSALTYGVGSRRSYGFGLVFVRPNINEFKEEQDLVW